MNVLVSGGKDGIEGIVTVCISGRECIRYASQRRSPCIMILVLAIVTGYRVGIWYGCMVL
jgi:hypothetical protein